MSKPLDSNAEIRRMISEAPLKIKNAIQVNKKQAQDYFDEDSFTEASLQFPSISHKHIYRRKADHLIEEGDLASAAEAYVTLQAISAQHQFLIQKMKLVNKINSEITRKFRLGEVRDATLLADRATSHREWRLMNFKPG